MFVLIVQGTAVVLAATFGIGSWSLNIYCMYKCMLLFIADTGTTGGGWPECFCWV